MVKHNHGLKATDNLETGTQGMSKNKLQIGKEGTDRLLEKGIGMVIGTVLSAEAFAGDGGS